MKKLFENIDDIYIKGSVDQLSEIVRTMDISLQNIANNTDVLTNRLLKYSASNKGAQYEKVVSSSLNLLDELFTASLELNEMQNQIVAYQNKIYRYEDMPEMAQKPNPYLINKRQINVDSSAMQFTRADMISLVTDLRNYKESVIHHARIIAEKKNVAASIWLDSQYRVFADFIDSVMRDVGNAVKVFEDYILQLDEKIKELG